MMVDLSAFSASDMEEIAYDFSADDNATETPVIRRRIVAVSEGRHNNIVFGGAELQKMVKNCVDLKAQKNSPFINAPITVGHTDNPLLKVGTPYDLRYDPTTKAAIADVLFWQDTAVQKDLSRLIKQDPDNTFFSVRVVGKMDDEGAMHDLKLIHIANVIQPADSNAKMLAELSDDSEAEDLSKKEKPSEDPVSDDDSEEDGDGESDGDEISKDKEAPEEDDDTEEDPDDEEEDDEDSGDDDSDEDWDDEDSDDSDDEEDDSDDEDIEPISDAETKSSKGKKKAQIDQSLYGHNGKINCMSNEEVTVEKLIELQRINDRFVADLEEAHRALIDAEAEIDSLKAQRDLAEEKGKLLAKIDLMNLPVNQEFVASLSVEQLRHYVKQMEDLSAANASSEESEEVEEAEEEEVEELSARVPPARGKAKASAGTVDLSADEQAIAIFGDVNKQRW